MLTVPWWSYPYLSFFTTTEQPNPEISPLSRAPNLYIYLLVGQTQPHMQINPGMSKVTISSPVQFLLLHFLS